MMPRSWSIAATGFSVIGVLVLTGAAMLAPGGPTVRAAADELADRSGADGGGGTAGSYDRSPSGIDRMTLPPGWSVLPEGTWTTAPRSAAELPGASSAWKEVGGEMPAGWTGAGALAGPSAAAAAAAAAAAEQPQERSRFAPAEPGSGGSSGSGRWPSRFSSPTAVSGR